MVESESTCNKSKFGSSNWSARYLASQRRWSPLTLGRCSRAFRNFSWSSWENSPYKAMKRQVKDLMYYDMACWHVIATCTQQNWVVYPMDGWYKTSNSQLIGQNSYLHMRLAELSYCIGLYKTKAMLPCGIPYMQGTNTNLESTTLRNHSFLQL